MGVYRFGTVSAKLLKKNQIFDEVIAKNKSETIFLKRLSSFAEIKIWNIFYFTCN